MSLFPLSPTLYHLNFNFLLTLAPFMPIHISPYASISTLLCILTFSPSFSQTAFSQCPSRPLPQSLSIQPTLVLHNGYLTGRKERDEEEAHAQTKLLCLTIARTQILCSHTKGQNYGWMARKKNAQQHVICRCV